MGDGTGALGMGSQYKGHDPIRRAIRERQATNCVNCGAPVNHNRHDCAYCSTQFRAKPEIFVSSVLAQHVATMEALRNNEPVIPMPPDTFKDRITDRVATVGAVVAQAMLSRFL